MRAGRPAGGAPVAAGAPRAHRGDPAGRVPGGLGRAAGARLPAAGAGRRDGSAGAGRTAPGGRPLLVVPGRGRGRTAALATGATPLLDPALAECDFGTWAGRTLNDVAAADPDGLRRWHADPDSAPHRGERLQAVRARAAAVLERSAALDGTTVAFTHGGFIKAALLEVLHLPATAIWTLDAAPGSVTELHAAPGSPSWRLTHLNWLPVPPGWPRDGQAARHGPPRAPA